MITKRKKRPRDPLQLAKLIGDIATGQVEDCLDDSSKSPATEFMRQGGLKGGIERARKLTPEQRSDIARIAAAARWKKSR